MLRIRWLGRVPYDEAHRLQRALHGSGSDQHLLLLEHPHVFTLGVRGDRAHLLVDPGEVGAELVVSDRGGDVTYHGPGQLVGYPIVSVPTSPGSVPAHVHGVEQLVIDALARLGLHSGRIDGYPGVWVEPGGANPRKICAVGIKVSRGRSMHGFALNVSTDLAWFDRIVPCGIADKGVTSVEAEGIGASMAQVVDAVSDLAAKRWAPGCEVDRQSVSTRRSSGSRRPELSQVPEGLQSMARGERLRIRLVQAGGDPDSGIAMRERKPPWMRVPLHVGPAFLELKRTVRGLGLVTVCEEAGCPNIFECWADGTATFMINGSRCTRACGFCQVDTSRPLPLDAHEPDRVAAAVERLGLAHAVVTGVARDDLEDGGARAFAATIDAIRLRCPGTAVEVLVPDFKGKATAVDVVASARPDVFNHNLETVARLQRAVRPSAGYARSLAVLARAKEDGLSTKSGLIVGMGESEQEVRGALADLRGVGVDVVTIGQYLRPSKLHLPVARWWTPAEFDRIRLAGEELGFAHVQASPLTRSSYHARTAAAAAAGVAVGAGTGAGGGAGSGVGELGDR